MLRKKLLLLVLPLAMTLSVQAQNPSNDPFVNDPFGDGIFKEMMQMQKEMDQMFNRMHHRIQQRSSGQISPLGTYRMTTQSQFVDKGDHYELFTGIPESKENHIDIKTSNGMMSVSAKIVKEQKKKNQNMFSTSRSVQMYQQSTSLPKDADEKNIKVAYKNGKMVIRIGKLKSAASAAKAVFSQPAAKTTSAPQKVEKQMLPTVKTPTADKEKSPSKSDSESTVKVKIDKSFDQTPQRPSQNGTDKEKKQLSDKDSMS